MLPGFSVASCTPEAELKEPATRTVNGHRQKKPQHALLSLAKRPGKGQPSKTENLPDNNRSSSAVLQKKLMLSQSAGAERSRFFWLQETEILSRERKGGVLLKEEPRRNWTRPETDGALFFSPRSHGIPGSRPACSFLPHPQPSALHLCTVPA